MLVAFAFVHFYLTVRMVTRCLFRSLRGKVKKKVKGKRAPYPWGGKGGKKNTNEVKVRLTST